MLTIEKFIRFLAAAMWKRKHGTVLAVFNYHQVSPEFDARFHGEHTWTQLDQFRAQMEFIKSYFQLVPLPEVLDRMRRLEFRGMHAAITFDDGDISMQQHVLPLLRQMGVPATFFVNTAYGSGRYYWYPVLNYLRHAADPSVRALLTPQLLERAGQLRRTTDADLYRRTAQEVESLAGHVEERQPLLVGDDFCRGLDGEQFTLGSHGHEHQRLSLMPPGWVSENLRKNAEILGNYRAYRPLFAAPFRRHCDIDDMVVRITLEQGHTLLAADGGVNIFRDACIRRMPADGRDAKALFNSQIVGW